MIRRLMVWIAANPEKFDWVMDQIRGWCVVLIAATICAAVLGTILYIRIQSL